MKLINSYPNNKPTLGDEECIDNWVEEYWERYLCALESGDIEEAQMIWDDIHNETITN